MPELPEATPRLLTPYYVVAGSGVLFTPFLVSAFGSGRTDDPNWLAMVAWILVAVGGIACAFQIARLGRSAVARVFGALFLAGHCASLLLLMFLCEGRH
jgi:uncharacterized membrane protein HdeD (DUF308 family)